MSIVTLLHVSDVHFGTPTDIKAEQPRVTAALINAVHSHVNDKNDKRPPDICVFSGDLTHSGEEEQFLQGEKCLCNLLKPFKGCRLFVIPGNHDVQRPNDSETLNEAKMLLRSAGAREELYTLFHKKIKDGNLLARFFEWHKKPNERCH